MGKYSDIGINLYKNYLEGILKYYGEPKTQEYELFLKDMTSINWEFLKHIETKQAELYFNENFNKNGEYIFHDDIGASPYHKKTFDGIMRMNTRTNRTTKIILGESTLFINWKIVNPKSFTKDVSLNEYMLNKYQKDNIFVMFILKNTSDPNYYKEDVKQKMSFKNNRVSSEGYQFYLLKPKDFFKGNKKIECNDILYNYEIGGELLMNFGKLLEGDSQLKIKHFSN